MYAIAVILVVLSLVAWAFLTLIKGGARVKLYGILKIYAAEMEARVDVSRFTAFYLGNAGIYYYPYLSNPLVRLAMQTWIVLGVFNVIIFAFSVYNYGLDFLTMLSLCALLLKLFSGTEAFYSYNNTMDVLMPYLQHRYQEQRSAMCKEITGHESALNLPLSEHKLLEYHELAKQITYSYSMGSETVLDE